MESMSDQANSTPVTRNVKITKTMNRKDGFRTQTEERSTVAPSNYYSTIQPTTSMSHSYIASSYEASQLGGAVEPLMDGQDIVYVPEPYVIDQPIQEIPMPYPYSLTPSYEASYVPNRVVSDAVSSHHYTASHGLQTTIPLNYTPSHEYTVSHVSPAQGSRRSSVILNENDVDIGLSVYVPRSMLGQTREPYSDNFPVPALPPRTVGEYYIAVDRNEMEARINFKCEEKEQEARRNGTIVLPQRVRQVDVKRPINTPIMEAAKGSYPPHLHWQDWSNAEIMTRDGIVSLSSFRETFDGDINRLLPPYANVKNVPMGANGAVDLDELKQMPNVLWIFMDPNA